MLASEPLLAGVRVLDLCDQTGDAIGRLLADLGADVIKVEPPGGSAARRALPTLDEVSIPFALHNANKRTIVLDPADTDDRRQFLELAGGSDIVVDSGTPGLAAAFGTSCDALADEFPHLVAMSVTDFGADGPRASWRATDPVLYAMSTALSRSGPTTGTPVLPPDGIASTTAAVQASWAVLVAYFNRLRCGTGDYIDFSRFDAVVLTLDPPFGTQGQAATARNAGERWRGRPRNQDSYPIFACRDGYVRICVLAPRQWRGMRAWLGEPEQFQDPVFDSIAARTKAFGELSQLMAALFADKTMAELVAEGQAHGVPIAAVLTPSEALESEHFAEVGALVDTEVAPGVTARVPAGYWVVDGKHAGYRTAAPEAGHSDEHWQTARFAPAATQAVGARPFEGIRVLDLGVIVAGGELSRLFGDLGAEVIKIESAGYPDGLRQKRPNQQISESFARAHRNQLGLGLELRSPAGAEVFSSLVAAADAMFANFKPGTLAALGFSHDRLRQLNPGLVLAESSAFGDAGPWSKRLGYGPLVRATIGVTRLWTSQEPPAPTARHAFYDATTIFPDHVVGRISAIGALAGLIRRQRDGIGARIHVSQAEAAINQLDTLYVTLAAAASGAGQVEADPAEHRVLPCAGDDEWCVVSIRSDADRRAVAAVIGDTDLADWVKARPPLQAAEALQAAGVPAGPMIRVTELADDPQLRLRKVFSDMVHPLLEHPLPTEAGPAPYRHIPPAPQRPAPLPGADTRQVCRDVLGMADDEIDQLIADGVLFAAETTGVTT
ncbi:CoA transferase [Mycobacterium crocinum]|uniref:CoA transferase n=1 Tax=Mycolicibacterium crocinum TaxID=388459 RepID=A0ABY3TDC4_9MYCO|nr:CoA transferase [Mycolicibacterium crocinum]MCV7214010.1 CoA transferase [Mycolicibacterium crocinum]ULN39439.1 CoA transferase [Mycolicibacterium crocinum]